MTTFEHIKARIVTIAEHTRPYLKKAWTIGCAYAVKFVDWCRATYHKARPHVIVGWKRLLPYLKQAWQIAGVAAEKVAHCCKKTYRLAKPHVITGLENLRQWFARLSPQGKNAVMIVSALFIVSLMGLASTLTSGSNGVESSGAAPENAGSVGENTTQVNPPRNDNESIAIAKKDAEEIPDYFMDDEHNAVDDGDKRLKDYLGSRCQNYDAWKNAAVANNPEGQFLLGLCNSYGGVVPINQEEGVQWFRKAADQGCALAQFYLGVCYELGSGVTKDKKEGVKWYRKAAEQGNILAQYNLGACYQFGNGCNEDIVESLKWHHKAAEQGYAPAQVHLGIHYDLDWGHDEVKAIGWYRKAAEQGNKIARDRMKYLELLLRERYDKSDRW